MPQPISELSTGLTRLCVENGLFRQPIFRDLRDGVLAENHGQISANRREGRGLNEPLS